MTGIRTGIGLFSGIDIGGLTEQLIAAQRAPARRLESRVASFQAVDFGLQALEANVLTLSTSVSTLGEKSTFDSLKVSNSSPVQLFRSQQRRQPRSATTRSRRCSLRRPNSDSRRASPIPIRRRSAREPSQSRRVGNSSRRRDSTRSTAAAASNAARSRSRTVPARRRPLISQTHSRSMTSDANQRHKPASPVTASTSCKRLVCLTIRLAVQRRT